MINDALRLTRLARYILRRVRQDGRNADAWREAFHDIIPILYGLLSGEISSEQVRSLFEKIPENLMVDDDKTNKISVNPLDNSQNSDKIELGNPQSNTDGGAGSGNHGHKGVKGQRGGSSPSGGGNGVTRFPRSGAKMSVTSDVNMKFAGKKVTIKAGTDIIKTAVFAGGASKKPLRVAGNLAKQYGGNAAKWKHTRGEATVDISGEKFQAELHWFENDSVGQVGLKVKRLME